MTFRLSPHGLSSFWPPRLPSSRYECACRYPFASMTRFSAVVAVFLALALTTPAAVASKRGPTDTPDADPRPAPLMATPGPAIRVFPSLKPQLKSHGVRADDDVIVTQPGPIPFGPPSERRMTHAGSSKVDLRNLPQTPPKKKEHPELEPPPVAPATVQ